MGDGVMATHDAWTKVYLDNDIRLRYMMLGAYGRSLRTASGADDLLLQVVRNNCSDGHPRAGGLGAR